MQASLQRSTDTAPASQNGPSQGSIRRGVEPFDSRGEHSVSMVKWGGGGGGGRRRQRLYKACGWCRRKCRTSTGNSHLLCACPTCCARIQQCCARVRNMLCACPTCCARIQQCCARVRNMLCACPTLLCPHPTMLCWCMDDVVRVSNLLCPHPTMLCGCMDDVVHVSNFPVRESNNVVRVSIC